MRKLNLSIIGRLSLLCSLGLSSCNPVIRNGEKVIMTSDQIGKFWRADNTDISGDTLILSKQNARLISRFKVKNFAITADLYTTGGAEGKLDLHTSSSDNGKIKGYSVKINNADYRNGDPQKTGSLSLIRNNYVRMVPDEKWFSLKIAVRGNNIKVIVNDKTVSEYNQPEDPLRIAGLEGMVLSEGLIVLQKTSESGTIVVGEISVEAYDRDLPFVPDNMAMNDSISMIFNLLNQQGFPVIDYHGHLKGGLTIDQVSEHGRKFGYNYGLAPNCGLNFPVTNDSSLMACFNDMDSEPVFKAMQCEGREWVTLFSPVAIARYDYIFTDAMTWTDHKGRRLRLWIPKETFVDDEQQFMDMLVGKIEAELSQEPVDIFVNPTYLPEVISVRYDQLWTEERMDRVIKALVENDVALEINSRFKIPSIAFVRRAKAAGVKFTLGTNNADNTDLGKLEYSLRVIKEAGIAPGDMFIPRPAGDKKVMKKGLPAKITG
jgi:hypothetical protein